MYVEFFNRCVKTNSILKFEYEIIEGFKDVARSLNNFVVTESNSDTCGNCGTGVSMTLSDVSSRPEQSGGAFNHSCAKTTRIEQ